jgi:hypothetical protein
VSSTPYYAEGGTSSSPRGYTTAEHVRLRQWSRTRLIAYFKGVLGGWTCSTVAGPPANAVLDCRQGRATVNVNLLNLATDRAEFDVVVDHAGAR